MSYYHCTACGKKCLLEAKGLPPKYCGKCCALCGNEVKGDFNSRTYCYKCRTKIYTVGAGRLSKEEYMIRSIISALRRTLNLDEKSFTDEFFDDDALWKEIKEHWKR